MKTIILFLTTLATSAIIAQTKITPTNSFTISGKVDKEKTITLVALDTFKTTTIYDVTMLNGKGEVKEKARTVKGILLKDLFAGVQITTQNKKAMNAVYLVFSAVDGFKLVLSWNEIFHAKSCTTLLLLTEKDGKKIKELDDRILLLAVDDANNGHERMKALQKIIVEQAN